jgi:tRNA pseudouridine38-40 synthase
VEGELTAALAQILQAQVDLIVAGRTDAGVHAWGQVASFEHGGRVPDRLALRLNAVAPHDLAVISAEQASADFDARRDARSRTYCYRVLASPVRDPFEEGRALWWPHELHIGKLERCAAALAGAHDFTAFTPTETEHVRFERDIRRAEWIRKPATNPAAAEAGAEHAAGMMLEFWIEADAFMRHMVRVLVGTMLAVAGGRRSHEDFVALLGGAPREAAGETAPAHGLYLASVRY